MSATSIGLIGMATLVGMILVRIPVGVALGLVGFVGYAAIDGFAKARLVFGAVPLELSSAYTLSVLPLFTLMGALATMAGLSGDLFRASNAIFAGMRGSLAMAAVGASAAFGAVCGSSLATAATMSRISIPQMLKAGYSPALAAGVVAAGGTLGILIPPSLILMIYGIIAQLSIIKLFAAALIPGLVLTGLYLITVWVWVRLRPEAAPKLPSEGKAQAFRLVLNIWDVAALFLVTFGGIYLGWFSPTEAAAVGAFGALLLGLLRRGFARGDVTTAFTETTRITANLILIVLGSTIFSYFVVQTGMAQSVVKGITALGLSPLAVMLLLIAFYVFLGCFLEGIGMVLVTVPVLLPLVLSTGYDPIWFGVLLVIVVEIGLIHPPVGMNLFVIRTQAPEISLGAMYRGVLPFLAGPFVLIAMLLAWPDLALWLPRSMSLN
ncbi:MULTISPECIES: TRAP transporter large permease [unclassified Bosea (in: a-proteobacteria)]|uniref:TRAP transporter large permease n=1 Tax=unclassified Bosea (in: a-proteobacteria) TaxID=2653178 RepID=UPI000F752803|nr:MULTISPECIES: TRAP transporter large permease [unclassified Bosea (in: a-proteobacteria)]AZO79136.1 C4-dicarboxylate ABC transporter permease [Bosea sp. Tri-49]RXT27469.1 C4-dicarboxylate ABC transporter permease [Bosea sp. Tri-39]RXT35826.1 C4-dicarboxylate ABC transporter permease [Bosea sp. Tri-54]